MYNLPHQIGIAVSVLTLAIVSSSSVLAKPQTRSKVIVTSQLTRKVAVMDNISPQPTEAILANVRFKASIQAKTSRVTRPKVVNPRSVTHISADQSSSGISTFTNVDRVNSPANNSSAIDGLVD